MNIIGIIPARMSSSRFPGKPLAEIAGIPMIGHVYYRSTMSKMLDRVYIATCDDEIRRYAVSIGAGVIMTGAHHQRASDRAAEAMLKIERQNGTKVSVVVMIQGDEPMLTPQMIDLAVKPMVKNRRIQVVNLMSPMKDVCEHEDPNEVKVVVDKEGYALYFSREPIPSRKKGATRIPMLKQVCIIPFRRDFLIRFNKLTPTPLEIIESVDMLRVLEHGYKVKMVMSLNDTYSVDTLDDLRCVAKHLIRDPLVKRYA